jgi:hypothetical protein
MSFSPPNVTPDTTEAIDDVIALLDAAMEELSKRRQQLLQRRNTLSPFGRLHPELVLEIFKVCTTEPMIFRESPIPRCKSWVPHAPNVRAVLRLSHVSRQFREITFSTGTLWSAPPFATRRGPSLINLALQRAASAPLSICLRRTPGSYDEWDVLRNSHILDLATTRDLWLPIGSWQEWMDALPTAMGLRSFCAHLDSPRSSSIIGLNTAHLTTLALAGTGDHLSPLGSSDATLSRLERLSLCLNQATQRDVALVLRILARAVRLTDFAFRVDRRRDGWLVGMPSSHPRNLAAEPLQKHGIRHIELLGAFLFNNALFRHLRLSAACAVRFSIDSDFNAPEKGLLGSNPDTLDKCATRHLVDAGCRPRHLTIDTTSPNCEHTAFRWTPDVTAEAGTGMLRFENFRSHCTSNGVDWTALTSLRLDISPEEYDDFFRGGNGLHQVLVDAPLNTLEVWAEVCERVFQDRHALRPEANPPFARLRLLRLIYPTGDDVSYYEELSDLSKSIHQFLAERTANGYPLEKLVVESWQDFRTILKIFSTSAPAVQYVDMW